MKKKTNNQKKDRIKSSDFEAYRMAWRAGSLSNQSAFEPIEGDVKTPPRKVG